MVYTVLSFGCSKNSVFVNSENAVLSRGENRVYDGLSQGNSKVQLAAKSFLKM